MTERVGRSSVRQDGARLARNRIHTEVSTRTIRPPCALISPVASSQRFGSGRATSGQSDQHGHEHYQSRQSDRSNYLTSSRTFPATLAFSTLRNTASFLLALAGFVLLIRLCPLIQRRERRIGGVRRHPPCIQRQSSGPHRSNCGGRASRTADTEMAGSE